MIIATIFNLLLLTAMGVYALRRRRRLQHEDFLVYESLKMAWQKERDQHLQVLVSRPFPFYSFTMSPIPTTPQQPSFNGMNKPSPAQVADVSEWRKPKDATGFVSNGTEWRTTGGYTVP